MNRARVADLDGANAAETAWGDKGVGRVVVGPRVLTSVNAYEVAG
jgi:hypothetical protein